MAGEEGSQLYKGGSEVHARLLVCHGVARDIAWRRKGSKCRGAHGRKKGRNARGGEGGARVHGDVGGEGEIEAVRHKPAQDWVILRYHVLRITVPIRVCVRVYLTVCTCTFTYTEAATTYRSRYFLFSSFFLSFPLSRSFAFLSPPFSHSPCPPSIHRRGRLVRLLFAARTRVSLAHTPEADRLQRVLKYRHAVHSLECIAYGGRS